VKRTVDERADVERTGEERTFAAAFERERHLRRGW
jgi:hypothetical protein